jgi:hypothetical protein
LAYCVVVVIVMIVMVRAVAGNLMMMRIVWVVNMCFVSCSPEASGQELAACSLDDLAQHFASDCKKGLAFYLVN